MRLAMGKKYKITNGKPEKRCGSEIYSGDIIELEEIEEVKESLEEKFYQTDAKYSYDGQRLCKELAGIARAHFHTHPEELGIKSVDDEEVPCVGTINGEYRFCPECRSAIKINGMVKPEDIRNKTEGLVKLEDVLKIFDEAFKEWNKEHRYLYTFRNYFREAIEGRKK